MASEAQATLRQLANATHYDISRAAHPDYLPIMGAARVVETGSRASVLDFGGSFVKRAIAHYAPDGTFNHVQIRDSLPNDVEEHGADAQHVFARMVDIIVQSYAEVDSLLVPVSLATYVDAQGQPRLVQGGTYAQLAQLTPDVAAALSQAVSARLGKAVRDQTAARRQCRCPVFCADGTGGCADAGHGTRLWLSGEHGPGLRLCAVSPTLKVSHTY